MWSLFSCIIKESKGLAALPDRKADAKVSIPIGLQDTAGKKHLSTYKAAMVRNSNLPALLGIDSLERLNAVISCRTGEMWFMDDAGCDIKPKGDF